MQSPTNLNPASRKRRAPKPYKQAVNSISPTHRLLGSSFLWLIFRILQGNPKKELLRSLDG